MLLRGSYKPIWTPRRRTWSSAPWTVRILPTAKLFGPSLLRCIHPSVELGHMPPLQQGAYALMWKCDPADPRWSAHLKEGST